MTLKTQKKQRHIYYANGITLTNIVLNLFEIYLSPQQYKVKPIFNLKKRFMVQSSNVHIANV